MKIEHKGEQKVSPRAPKGSQKRAKWSQEGAKGSEKEPKVRQIHHKITIREKVAKRSPKWKPLVIQDRPFWEQFSMKDR